MGTAARLALGLFAGWLAGCGAHPSDPVAAARFFYEQVLAGRAREAYRTTAFVFQSQLNERAFEATVREMGLVGGKLQTLTAVESAPESVRVRAELLTATGEARPLVTGLQLENNAWRVFSVRSPRDVTTGLSENRFSSLGKEMGANEALSQPMPAQKEIEHMVHESIMAFADAISERSFTAFYEHTSEAWKQRLTENQLERAFKSFIDNDVHLQALAKVPPVFDAAPHLTTEGLLVVAGYYPTKPYEVVFELKYIYELPEWKLFGLNVRARLPHPSSASAKPGAPVPSGIPPPVATPAPAAKPPAVP